MRKKTFICAMLLCAFTFIISAQSVQNSRKSEENTKWIAESLREMKTVEAGKTRADLLEVLTTEGGISTGPNRTFVYRKCPLIKVDVEFEAVGRAARDAEGRVTFVEDHRDKIKSISKPYLEWSVID